MLVFEEIRNWSTSWYPEITGYRSWQAKRPVVNEIGLGDGSRTRGVNRR